MFSAQTATSRARLRGTATHSATGASADRSRAPPAAGSFSRRRSAGAATPAATRAQAVARMPLDARKGAEYMAARACRLRPTPRTGEREPQSPRLDRMPRPCDVPCAKPARGDRGRALAVALALVGSLILAPGAFAGFITPKSGGSPNANQIASAVQDHPVHRGRRVRDRRGRAGLLGLQVPRQEERGRRPDPRQHPAGDRLDGRRGGDPRGADRGHLREAAGHHQPAELERQRTFLSASRHRAEPAQRQEAARSASRAASTSGATPTAPTARTPRSHRSCPTPTRRWSCRRTRRSCS